MKKELTVKELEEIVSEAVNKYDAARWHFCTRNEYVMDVLVHMEADYDYCPLLRKYIYKFSHMEAAMLADNYGKLTVQDLLDDGYTQDEAERVAWEIEQYMSIT
jgi:hypothetical protein